MEFACSCISAGFCHVSWFGIGNFISYWFNYQFQYIIVRHLAKYPPYLLGGFLKSKWVFMGILKFEAFNIHFGVDISVWYKNTKSPSWKIVAILGYLSVLCYMINYLIRICVSIAKKWGWNIEKIFISKM